MSFQLIEATIDSIHAAMRAGELTCRELVEAYLDRIEAYDRQGPCLTSVQTVNPSALAEADRLDAQLVATGFRGALFGIPVLLKDQAETSDMPTTYGSALFKDFVPKRDATVVQRLRAAGAIIIAKNTISEFAQPGYHGSAFGFSRNAYDPTRVPGGSSCGTGVSVASNFGVVGVGEDTGGSVRNPASQNCLVGLRPTVGLISRFGLLPGTPTRDTLGPMTRTVRDAAILLDVLAGYDPNDPITAYSVGRMPESYASLLRTTGLQGKRLGLVRTPFATNVDTTSSDYAQVWGLIEKAMSDMASHGAEIVDPGPIDGLLELLRRPAGGGESEAAINRYFADHENAPARTAREIVLAPDGSVHPGHRATMAEKLGQTTDDPSYLRSLQTREELREQTLKLMADLRLDALAFPTLAGSAGLIDPDILTSSAPRSTSGSNGALSTTTAFPSLTVPAGFTSGGLPVGLSLFGRPFSESLLLQIAFAYEQHTTRRRPPSITASL